MAVIDFKETQLFLQDGTGGTPKEAEIIVGEGNLTFDETVTREYRLNRGKLNEVKNGDETPMAVSFDFEYQYLRGDGVTPSLEDALKNRYAAATWITTDASDPCAPYALNIKIVYDPDCAVGDMETTILPDFRYESLNHDISGSTISCSGNCNATQATSVRTAP